MGDVIIIEIKKVGGCVEEQVPNTAWDLGIEIKKVRVCLIDRNYKIRQVYFTIRITKVGVCFISRKYFKQDMK